MSSSPLRPPPVCYSQFDDGDDDAYIPATQSDIDELSASSGGEDAALSDGEMERIRKRQERRKRNSNAAAAAAHAQNTEEAASAMHTAAAAGGSVRPRSPPICILDSTDDDEDAQGDTSEGDDAHAHDADVHEAPDSPLQLMADDEDENPPHSPDPGGNWSPRDRSEGEATPDEQIDIGDDDHPPETETHGAAAAVETHGAVQARADSDGWMPAFTQTLSPHEDTTHTQSRRHSTTQPAPHPAAAAAAAAASTTPVAAVPSASGSRSASSFLAAAPRKDDIASFSDDERMGDGDQPDPIEDFTPSPPPPPLAARAAAGTAASASAPVSNRSVHAPFKPPRMVASASAESSIDLTDSPPPSPSAQQWADRFLPAASNPATAAAAAAAAPPARPSASTAAPSAGRIGSAHALSAAMASSAAPVSRPIPTLNSSSSKLFSRLTPPMTAPSAPSASAAAAAAAAQEAMFSEIFDAAAATPTPHTAALLNEGRPPALQRSQATFMRKNGTEPHPSTAAAASSSSSRPPPSRPDAAAMAKLAARRQQEADDAAFVQRMVDEERRAAVAAAAAAGASSAVGSFQMSPAKRHKAEQPSIKSWLSPTKPSSTAGAAAACAPHAASSDAALNASSWHAPPPRKSIFTKQSLAHGQKRKDAPSPDADDRENHDSSREHSREGSRSNSPLLHDSLLHRAPKTARDLIPKSVDQLHRSLPGFLDHPSNASSRKLVHPRSSKFKDAKLLSKQSLAARVAKAADRDWAMASAAAAARQRVGSASPAPATAEPDLSQLSHQPPPALISLRPDHQPMQFKRTASEISRMVQKIQQQVAAKHELQRVELKLTPAQREANRIKEAEIQARRERHERKANEVRRLQPSLDKLHADVLTWNVHEVESSKSVAHKLHARLTAIPLQFENVAHYQSIMYPLLLEECRATIEQQLEEMRGGMMQELTGGPAGSKQNAPVAAVFGPLQRTDKGHITMVDTDLRISALDAPNSSAAAAAAARDASRSTDRLGGFQHDDLVILWRNAPPAHHVGPLFEDEEGEIDQSLLALTDWTQAAHAHLALLQDFDNKNELNRAENAAAKVNEAVAAEAAASANGGHHRRRDDPPFKLRLFFDSNDAHSNELKRNFFSRSGAGGGGGAGGAGASSSAGGASSSGSNGGSRWIMLKLQNLKTVHREYSALQSCEHLTLKDAILKPLTTAQEAEAKLKAAVASASPESSATPVKPAAILSAVSRNLTLSLMQAQVPPTLAAKFNLGQLQAIAKVLMKREGFSLIQGPPGTGKTTTIVGLISMLHMQFQAKLFMKGHTSSYKPPGTAGSGGIGASGSAWARQLSSTAASNLQRSSSSASTKHFRLLVCAPSNAAINEIIDRMEDALVDCDGSKLQLNIVRLGAGSNKEKEAQAQPRNQRGAKGAPAATMPFHDRISLDNLVREHKAGGGDSLTTSAEGSLPRSVDLSTPLSILQGRAARAVDEHHALMKQSDAIHDRIKQLEHLIRFEEMQAEHELDLKRAEDKRAASPAMAAAAAAAAPSSSVSPLAAYVKELAELEIQKKVVLQRKNEKKHVVNQLKSRERVEARTALSPTDSLRASILQGAHVILTTLSGAGIEFFRNLKLSFSTVIVDESAQSSEVASLIPLKYNVKRCILVGDPSQLSATVRSRRAVEYAWKQSLFQRLQLNQPEGVEMLTTQYRMHWEIVRWPSNMFYAGRLQTAQELCEELIKAGHVSMQPAASAASSRAPKIDLRLAPYVLYDVEHGRESTSQRSSLFNVEEAELTVQLFLFLKKQLAAQANDAMGGAKSSADAAVRPSSVALTRRIGVISPYQRQVSELRRRFSSKLSDAEMAVLEIDSVDAFQGREKDFIIFSCVRAPEKSGARKSGIGFLSEFARLNVALTRARLGMYIVAHANTVSQDATWANLVLDARARHRVICVPPTVSDLFRSALWSETKWLAEMEPCPMPTATTTTAGQKSDKMGAAAAAAGSATKTVTSSSTAAAAAANGKTGPSAPSKNAPHPVVPVTASAPVAAAAAAAASASSSAAADPSILSLDKVLKKPARPEGALFLNEQRTGVVRPPVPMPIAKPSPAASHAKPHGIAAPLGALTPLGSKHAAGPQPILKPIRPAAGAAAGASGLSAAAIAAVKLAASKPSSARRPIAAAAASSASPSSVPPKRVAAPPPAHAPAAASSAQHHAQAKSATSPPTSTKPNPKPASKSKAGNSSSSDSSSDDSSDDELLLPQAGKSKASAPTSNSKQRPAGSVLPPTKR